MDQSNDQTKEQSPQKKNTREYNVGDSSAPPPDSIADKTSELDNTKEGTIWFINMIFRYKNTFRVCSKQLRYSIARGYEKRRKLFYKCDMYGKDT